MFQEDFVDGFQVITYLTTNYTNNIYTEEEGIVKWLPYIFLTKSKSWKKENSNLYYKLIKE
jgi:hypothetical protein